MHKRLPTLLRPHLPRPPHPRLIRHHTTQTRSPFPFPTKSTALITTLGLASTAYYYLSQPPPPSHDFTPSLTLTSATPISPTSSILSFTHSTNNPHPWHRGTWSLAFAQTQLNMVREYTPLPPSPSTTPGQLDFLIRRTAGEMSNHLFKLVPGAQVWARPPSVDYDIPPDAREIVFIAGGTGIAPALQMAHALSLRQREAPYRMRILWANRTAADAFGGEAKERRGRVVDLVKRIGGGLDMEMQVFVDEERRFVTAKDVQGAMSRDAATGRKLLVLSGPPGFVQNLIGTPPRPDTVVVSHEGVPGGLLKGCNLNGWEVVVLKA